MSFRSAWHVPSKAYVLETGGMSEVSAPHVVVGRARAGCRVVGKRDSRIVVLAPGNVVGRIHNAVAVVVAARAGIKLSVCCIAKRRR